MKPFNIILAATPKGEIGYKNTIPWKLQGDLKRFKELTMGNICIMGRNTYESLPKPLEGRKMIVVSSTMAKAIYDSGESDLTPIKANTYVARNLKHAIALAEHLDGKEVFVIGGVRLYEEALALTTVTVYVHLTVVYKEPEDIFIDYDAVIPNFSMLSFVATHDPKMIFGLNTENNIPQVSHAYTTWIRQANTLPLNA